MYDILIKNGRIIDGTGAPWFYGSIGIKDELLYVLEPDCSTSAETIIDATGMFVCPGFIDAHSHSDFPLLINPDASSKIRMGVTTEVIGQCGASAAPKAEGQKDFFGYNLDDLGLAFSTFGEYLTLLESKGIAVNVIPLVGHGNIRSIVIGEDDRPPSQEELIEMQFVLAKALEEGACGMTTGLIYPPGCYADTEELIALGHTLNQYNAIYATHMRDEKDNLIASINETIEIGRQANIPTHISHYKVCNEVNWGLVSEGLKLIEEARLEGIDVTMDQYPYIASSTSLKTLVPQWAHDGGIESLRKRVLDSETRTVIREEMLDPIKGTPRYDWVVVTSCQKDHNKRFEGLNLVEIGQLVNKEPVDACLDLLLDEDFGPGMVRFSMCEEDVKLVMQHPLVMIGSDASGMKTSGPLSTGKPHPRAYGTFARVLGKYSLMEKIMPIETAVFKMTGLPATRFNLHKRGLLKDEFYADITIFDPETIKDVATFKDPHQYAAGIEAVFVNGELVVAKDEQYSVYPGRVLRRRK